MDTRHQLRIKIVQELYAYSFLPAKDKTPRLGEFDKKTRQIIKKQDKINDYIVKFASKFPINKIAKIDLAILQLGIYELLYEKKEPTKVIINEAVELAKDMGSERSYAFINAILGKIYQETYERKS